MLKRIFVPLMMLVNLSAIVGCNTMHGLGQDIERAGEKTQDAAKKTFSADVDRDKPFLHRHAWLLKRPPISVFMTQFQDLGLIVMNRDYFLIIKEKKLTDYLAQIG